MHRIKPSLFSIALLLLFTAASFAQQKSTDYDKLWKIADSLVSKKGLPKSALAQANSIYALAKKENQQTQVIKALIYRMSLQEMVDENADTKSFRLLEDEINSSNGAAKSILQSILSFKYRVYFEQPYTRSKRTNTKNFPKDDIATWTNDDFYTKIGGLYEASLQNKTLLQHTYLDDYNPIIMEGNVRWLRPTLYDLLAYAALDFYAMEGWSGIKPANAFEMKDENLLAPAAGFARAHINTTDTTSLIYKAVTIYQDLLRFHLADAKPDALIDADIHRLKFVYDWDVVPQKKELYEKALTAIVDNYSNAPAAAEAAYLVANMHVGSAIRHAYSDPDNMDEGDTSDLMFAAAICKRVLQQPGESEGKSDCYNLLKSIEQRSLHLVTEKVNIPGQPFRTLVSYCNCNNLFLRIIPLNAQLKSKLGYDYDTVYWKRLFHLAPLRNWTQVLPGTSDYHSHSTEIKIDGLPAGEYMLLGSLDPAFSIDSNIVAVQYFFVSGISYITNKNDCFVLDRETGRPLAKAVIQQYWKRYDSNKSDYVKSKGQRIVTDEHGFAKLPGLKNYSYEQMRLSVYYEKDSLCMDEYTYSPLAESINMQPTDSTKYEKDHAGVYLFADRSIYRPGQTVYFKGIVVTKDRLTGKKKPYSGQHTKLVLSDVNDTPIDSMEVVTNGFGSYSGRFRLPANLLNGQFAIRDKSFNAIEAISVEEYKRPKFYVEFDTVRGSYRINDSITVTGFAKAYAGNTIDGAKVSYRVRRLTRFIYPWLFRSRRMPSGDDQEISNGILSTATDGSFRLRFKAIPDLSVSKDLDPVFDYRISVNITDVAGETHSSEKTVQVSYKTIQLTITLPGDEQIPSDSFRFIGLDTHNSAGDFIAAPVTLSISRLQSPARLIRERYWQQPDQFAMTREEYLASFPTDEYKDERDPQTWSKEPASWQATDTTGPLKQFPVGQRLPQGWYMVEAVARDINGDSVKDVKYLRLFDEKSNTLPTPAYTWTAQESIIAEPGQQVNIRIGSSADNLFVIQQVDKERDDDDGPGPTSTYHFIPLNNEKKTFDFTPAESDRGGFGVYHFFVKNNRFYSLSNRVSVPWSNKELTIQYETFRDKTLPGSEEKWRLKISGPKKEKAAAEVLAGMYDASLDEFRPQGWSIPSIYGSYTNNFSWNAGQNFQDVPSVEQNWEKKDWESFRNEYDILVTGLKQIRNTDGSVRAITYQSGFMEDVLGKPYVLQVPDWEKDPDGSKGYTLDSAVVPTRSMLRRGRVIQHADAAIRVEADAAPRLGYAKADVADYAFTMPLISIKKEAPAQSPAVQIRKNFNETAFFLPDLQTDSAGDISFGFTMPEALTQWKFQALAHTKDLAFGYTSTTIVTQKPLMVQPNAPRFLREGDRMDFSAKVVNLTDKEQTGTVQLELLNAATNESADGWFRNMYPVQYFTAEAGQSTVVKFSIDVPYQYNSALLYRFVAKAGDNSDGEEASLPVLTNTMLVTESMPLPVRGNGSKNFKFEKLLQSGNSETLQQHALTIEFTSNPAWYAVQALPYLVEYPYECAEQTFNRYYANSLASMIAGSSPRLQAIVSKWNTSDTTALLSNLQKNEELKSVLLEETPWVLDAKTEAQQKKNIALLFDMVRMKENLSTAFEKLKQLQQPSGGFVWFKGGHEDRYITQYILSGIGHLKKLHALGGQQDEWKEMIKAAIAYTDLQIRKDYDYLVRHKVKLDQNNLGNTQIQYLYLRSMFNEYDIPGASFTAINYYRKQSRQYWLQQSKYMQGMIALSLFRTGDIQTAKDILKSLKENATINEEMGMYWKDNVAGYYWQQAPIETQSLLIEAFSEIGKDTKTIDDLKTWLLKQKQVQDWGTTRATAEACYALLLQGSDWLNNTPEVSVKLGDKTVSSTEQAEAGTGYFKQRFEGPFVNPSMGDISVRVATPTGTAPSQSSWGAVYWQYFERMDRITPAATPLRLDKKLFVERNTDRGPVLEPIAENGYLKVGDKIKVRIELRVDRTMEYVHMKDMRASCMEPVNVLSEYKWQDGLGYYESTKDASTSFFFDQLPKGTYVFEYELFVTHAGNFSNGITTIQCMYAPEFASHSEGVRVNVEQ